MYREAEVILVASQAEALERQPQGAYIDVEDVEHLEQLLDLRVSIIDLGDGVGRVRLLPMRGAI